MVVSFKDIFKLIGISIVCCCAVFVCTFFLNFYVDVQTISDLVTEELQPLYDAQLTTAQFTCAITGGFLGVIAVIMLIFYIKMYVDANAKNLGVMKAMGYGNGKLALRFCVFGASVLLGALIGFGLGFALMPYIYKQLSIEGLPQIEIHFHAFLPFALVVAPTVIFSALSCIFAYVALKRPVSQLLRGNTEKRKQKKIKIEKESAKERSFLKEMCLKTLGSKKTLAFFFAFSCFCFSAMVQMGASMEGLTSQSMGLMILLIGLVLAVTSLFMAATSLINANIKNISIMKSFGYSLKECAVAVLGGYIPFGIFGFALGTVYQYGLLYLMVNVIFKEVGDVVSYSFSVPVFFYTLAAFLVFYAAVITVYVWRMSKISVKKVMEET